MKEKQGHLPDVHGPRRRKPVLKGEMYDNNDMHSIDIATDKLEGLSWISLTRASTSWVQFRHRSPG